MKNNIHGFPQQQGFGTDISPRIRVSDKLSFNYQFNYNLDPFNIGFANFDSAGNVIFGGRETHTFVNTLSGKYIFKNDLSLSINARHYWATGEYKKYYTLLDNGLLSENTTYSSNNDFSTNFFNVDAVFSWQFAPGSLISIVYKNAIEKDENIVPNNYADNFSNTFKSPQTNSISLKVLYYLDYQYLKKRK